MSSNFFRTNCFVILGVRFRDRKLKNLNEIFLQVRRSKFFHFSTFPFNILHIYLISSYSLRPRNSFCSKKISLLCKKLNYCGNYLKLLRLPNSKKNSFRFNCMRKNGKVEIFLKQRVSKFKKRIVFALTV